MKITKQFLTQLIKEELNNLGEMNDGENDLGQIVSGQKDPMAALLAIKKFVNDNVEKASTNPQETLQRVVMEIAALRDVV